MLAVSLLLAGIYTEAFFTNPGHSLFPSRAAVELKQMFGPVFRKLGPKFYLTLSFKHKTGALLSQIFWQKSSGL